MRIFRHFDTLADDARGAAVAIGNFDGVHPGHRAVINEAGLIARADNVPWAVLTFEPHPRQLFLPNQAPFRLTPFRAKARAIEAMGVDLLIVQRFNKAFSEMEAEDFVRSALVKGLGAHHVVSGYDFVFGHNRGGHCDLLLAMGEKEGFGFTATSALVDDTHQAYSSTRIRERLKDADPAGAAKILGHDFELSGRVAHGDRRGRDLGFPTANIHLGRYIRPANGVYAVRVRIEGDDENHWRDGVANIGARPTFGGDGIVLEVFLFDFDQEIYGKRLHVRLVDFLRGEKKFDGLDPLKAQIALDTKKARKILTATPD
ncbi:MAG: bifunctional riboflavin kinase/FAD synthetase [Alphaproteobacteria bacterium]|jgi:riboflavin kinase / FMN adenylyltransferase|nr:bifunctional riboflavin kinase/FAD synthetase [Alphaproteobacteria bacterium]MBT7941826.1 bifunctional riboflavin kinase/FAD synthetase [Alphaproteobacteria bacterium]